MNGHEKIIYVKRKKQGFKTIYEYSYFTGTSFKCNYTTKSLRKVKQMAFMLGYTINLTDK